MPYYERQMKKVREISTGTFGIILDNNADTDTDWHDTHRMIISADQFERIASILLEGDREQ